MNTQDYSKMSGSQIKQGTLPVQMKWESKDFSSANLADEVLFQCQTTLILQKLALQHIGLWKWIIYYS